MERELSAFRTAAALKEADQLLTTAKVIGDLSVISATLGDGMSSDDLRQIANNLRSKISRGVVVLASNSDGRISLVVSASSEANAKGVKAGSLVKVGSAILGGGGGGKDDFAQGGGSEVAAITAALQAIDQTIHQAQGM